MLSEADAQGLISAEELKANNAVEHVPMLMIDQVRTDLRKEARAHRAAGGGLSCNWYVVMGADIKALVDALGGCERIAKTPMPFNYLALLRMVTLLWLLSYPLTIADAFGWYTLPFCAFVMWFMLKIDEMAAEIEHPFGLASHDLALEAICKTIERNLLEVMKRVEGRDLGA